MSSPLDRDFGPDEPSPYAPKWVRDAADARRDKTAEPPGIAPKSPENPDQDGDDFQRSAATPPEKLDRENFRRSGANSAASNEPALSRTQPALVEAGITSGICSAAPTNIGVAAASPEAASRAACSNG